jgi:DNA-binding transcriptional MerR regulator
MTFGTGTQAVTENTILDEGQSASRQGQKSDSAYRTISEVATDLNLPQHVLRFWESKFKQISPLKRGGGRRYYRPQDVDLIKRIHHLLHTQGYTIKGVQKLLVKDRQLQQSVPSITAANDTASTETVATTAVSEPIAAQAASQQGSAVRPSTQLPTNTAELRLILNRLKTLRSQIK